MADYVSIANLAVGFLGEDDQLRSPDDDTHVARTVAAAWELTRRAAIRAHSWNFAIRRARLPAEALDLVPYPWTYSFPLPTDSLRLVEVMGYGRSDYQLEGRAILSDSAGPLDIRHLVDVPEPALWDASFDIVMAMRLAFQVADRITGDRARKVDAWNAFTKELSDAKRIDALENPVIAQEPGDWEIARWGGERGSWGGQAAGWRNWGPYIAS